MIPCVMHVSLVGIFGCPFLPPLPGSFDSLTSYIVTSGPPLVQVSLVKYYLVILDDCTHYSWTFSLCQKSDMFPILSHFSIFVSTQFGYTIRSVQCDNSTCTFSLSRRPASDVVSLYFST
jgi:hypothetical protein